MLDKEEKRKKDEKLFFEAMDLYSKAGVDKALVLSAMKAIFTNMDDLDIKIGDKND